MSVWCALVVIHKEIMMPLILFIVENGHFLSDALNVIPGLSCLVTFTYQKSHEDIYLSCLTLHELVLFCRQAYHHPF